LTAPSLAALPATVPDEQRYDFEQVFNGDFGSTGFVNSNGGKKFYDDPIMDEVIRLDEVKRWAASVVPQVRLTKDDKAKEEAIEAEKAVVYCRIDLINALIENRPQNALCLQVNSKRKQGVSVSYRLLEDRNGALFNAQTQVTWPADIEWPSLHPISHRYTPGADLPSNVTGALHLMVVRSIMSACRDASTKKLRDIYWALGLRNKPLQFTQEQVDGTGVQARWELPETLHSITHAYHARVDIPEGIQTEPIDVIVYWGVMKINYCDQWHNPLINAYVRNTVVHTGRMAIRNMQDWHEGDDRRTAQRPARSYMHNYLRPVIRIQHGHRIHVLSLAPFFGPDTCSVEHILVTDEDNGILDLVNKDIRDVGYGINVHDNTMHFYHCVGTKPNARYNEQQLNYLHAHVLAQRVPALGGTRAAARLGMTPKKSEDSGGSPKESEDSGGAPKEWEDSHQFHPVKPRKQEPGERKVPAKQEDSDDDDPRSIFGRHQRPSQRERFPDEHGRGPPHDRQHKQPRALPWAPKPGGHTNPQPRALPWAPKPGGHTNPQPRGHTAPPPGGRAWAPEPKQRDTARPPEPEPADNTQPEPGPEDNPGPPEPEEQEPEEQAEQEPEEQEQEGQDDWEITYQTEEEEEEKYTQFGLPKPGSKDAKSARISFTDWDVLVSSYKFKGMPAQTLITLINYPPHGMRYTKDALHASSPAFRSHAPDKHAIKTNEAFWVKWYSKERGHIFEWKVNLIDKDPSRRETQRMRERYASVRLSVQTALQDTATGGTWWIESDNGKHKFTYNLTHNEKRTAKGTALDVYQAGWRAFFIDFIERNRGPDALNYLWVSKPDQTIKKANSQSFRKINVWEEILGDEKMFMASAWELVVKERHEEDTQNGFFDQYKLASDIQELRGGQLRVDAADRLPIVPRPAPSALLERIKTLEAAKLEDARKAKNREHLLCKMLERLAPAAT
jgi:hypothetical protein